MSPWEPGEPGPPSKSSPFSDVLRGRHQLDVQWAQSLQDRLHGAFALVIHPGAGVGEIHEAVAGIRALEEGREDAALRHDTREDDPSAMHHAAVGGDAHVLVREAAVGALIDVRELLHVAGDRRDELIHDRILVDRAVFPIVVGPDALRVLVRRRDVAGQQDARRVPKRQHMVEERLDLLRGLVHVRAGPGIPRQVDLLHVDYQDRVFFSHHFHPF